MAINDYSAKYPTRDKTVQNYRYVYNRCFDEGFTNLNILEIDENKILQQCFKVIGVCNEEGQRSVSCLNERMNLNYFKKNFRGLLNLVFNYAYRQKIITTNPLGFVDFIYLYSLCKQTHRKHSHKRHSENEYDMILKEALMRSKLKQFHGYYIYFYLIVVHGYLGCRPGELVALKWSDIYDGQIHICHEQIEHKKPKTWYEYTDYTKNEKGISKSGRSFPMIPELSKILTNLKDLQDSMGIKSEFIFCDEAGKWIVARAYERTLYSICTKLGIDSKGTYTFRRDVNNRMSENGMDTFVRAEMLGHDCKVNLECYDAARTPSVAQLEKALNRGDQYWVSLGITC